jgi:hypothetical protein
MRALSNAGRVAGGNPGAAAALLRRLNSSLRGNDDGAWE